MSFEIPSEKIRLDCEGNILHALQEDAFMTINEIYSAIASTYSGDLIEGAASLIVEGDSTVKDVWSYDTFYSSAAVAFMALNESDADAEVRKMVFKQMKIRNVPCSLLGDTPEETIRSFHVLASAGHKSHPELRDATELLMDYHAKRLPELSLARIAFCGIGFGIQQIDMAWTRSREQIIDSAWKDQLKSFDVSTLLY